MVECMHTLVHDFYKNETRERGRSLELYCHPRISWTKSRNLQCPGVVMNAIVYDTAGHSEFYNAHFI